MCLVRTVASMSTTSPLPDDGRDLSVDLVRVAVVFHSGTGHTRVQAEAVHRGAARVTGVAAELIAVDEVESRWQSLDGADAIVFGTPTYMAGPSASFKAFLDATAPRWQEQRWRNKLAAGFTNSAGMNGDKLATLQALALFAMAASGSAQRGGVTWTTASPPSPSCSAPTSTDSTTATRGACARCSIPSPATRPPPTAR